MEVNVFFNSMIKELEHELATILEFWALQTVDKKNGGFIGQMDHFGKVNPEASKGSVLNARILWTFSVAYRNFGSNQFEKLAERAFAYLSDHFWDNENGGLFWETDYKGNPLNTRKQAYAQGFGIYAFSEYYRATAKKESLYFAVQLFHLIENKFWDTKYGGYIEALDKNFQPLEDMRLSEKDANSPKSMNTHLHLLEPFTNLYRVWPDKQLNEAILHLIKLFLNHIIDAQTGHFKLFFETDWSGNHPIVSYGHSIEGAWLLREAALLIGDEALIKNVERAAIRLVDAVLKEGMDTDGSVFNEFKNGQLDTDKDWWPQAEAMVGLMDAWQSSGNPVYLDALKKGWSFIKENVIDTENGEWFGKLNRDGIPYENEDKVGFWKCPYHNTRALIELIQRIKLTSAV